MAYDAVYVVRADIEAELDATTFNSALTDSEKTPEEVYEGCAEAADAEVASAVALIQAMGRSAPPVAFLRYCGKIFMCRLLYRRHGLGGERNPYDDSAEDLRKQLNDIANGDLKSGGFGHLSIEDAQPNIFMEDGDATASSSSGGGGGGGGGGTAGVSTLNGLEGNLNIAAGDNISIAASGNTITVTGQAGGVTSVSGLTGSIAIVGGDNVTVTPSGNTLSIAATVPPGGVTSVNGEDGAISIVAGQNIEIAQDGGVLTISGEEGGVSSVNGKAGAVGIVGGHNVTVGEDAQGRIEIASSGASPFIPETRVITALTATVLATDYLIWFDSETAGDSQTITLPDMEADAMTIVVRHLGSDYPTYIVRGNSTYQLAGNGAAVAIDWLKATGEWYWRQAY